MSLSAIFRAWGSDSGAASGRMPSQHRTVGTITKEFEGFGGKTLRHSKTKIHLDPFKMSTMKDPVVVSQSPGSERRVEKRLSRVYGVIARVEFN